MSKTSLVEQSAIDQARQILDRTTIIAVTVSQYSHLPRLPGAGKDLRHIKNALITGDTAIYGQPQFIALENQTVEQARQAVLKYAYSRSAHGDVLMFYFSGHGCIIGDNDFGFCLTDTMLSAESKIILPLSVLSFREVVQTLSIHDVHPVFIIDACFSGATARTIVPSIGAIMDHELYVQVAGSYGLLCSSSADTTSIDTNNGGVFTNALCSIVSEGLSDRQQRHWPFVTMRGLASPLQDRLAHEGYSLPKCYIGPDLPEVPIAKNASYKPQSEYFSPQMRKVIEHLWNNGSPREATGSELGRIAGAGAYANHSKLSLQPWNLLEDGHTRSSRRLTRRGKQFAQGKIAIPKRIIKDPITWKWIAVRKTERLSIDEV